MPCYFYKAAPFFISLNAYNQRVVYMRSKELAIHHTGVYFYATGVKLLCHIFNPYASQH
jgi:hypothetical protein